MLEAELISWVGKSDFNHSPAIYLNSRQFSSSQKMKTKIHLSILISLFSTQNFASPLTQYDLIKPERSAEIQFYESKLNGDEITTSKDKTSLNIEINDEQLSQQPKLLAQFIHLAIEQQQVDLIPILLAMYQKYQDIDLILVNYAKGIYAASTRDYAKAIEIYNALLAADPNLDKVRWQLAQWLYQDKQFKQAREQFSLLKNRVLPDFIQQQINLYQQAIAKKQALNTRLSLYYVEDHNINNASSTPYVTLNNKRFKKIDSALPQKAKGINYTLNLNKVHHLTRHHNLYFENELNGQYYWQNKTYNEISNRIYLGYQYQNSDQRLALLPFYAKRWLAQKPYSQEKGGRVEFDQRLSADWQFSSSAEWGKSRYAPSNKMRNKRLYSATFSHWFSPNTQGYLGSDFLQKKYPLPRESSVRHSLKMGFVHHFQLFSIQQSISFAKRHFNGKDLLLNKKRKDIEWQFSTSIWKKDWQFWQITPKLHYRYQKIRSNIPEFFSFDKHQFNLLFDKSY